MPVLALLAVVSCASSPDGDALGSGASPESMDEDTRRAAEELVRASALRESVFRYGLDEFESSDFALAEDRFEAGKASYRENTDRAERFLSEAADLYERVLGSGLPILAERRRDDAERARTFALEVKAEIAEPELFSSADLELGSGRDALARSEYERAIYHLELSIGLFDQARRNALEMLGKADESIAAARTNIRLIEQSAAELARAVTYPDLPLVAAPSGSDPAEDDSDYLEEEKR